MLGKEVRKMNNPRLKASDWNGLLGGKEVIVIWNEDGKCFTGKVIKIALKIDGDFITVITMTMAVCFQVWIKDGEPIPFLGSRKVGLKVTFDNPGQMNLGMDVIKIHCDGKDLAVTNDPEVHSAFSRTEAVYDIATTQNHKNPKPAKHP